MPPIVKTLIWSLAGAALLVLFTQLRYEWVFGDAAIPLTGQSLIILVIGFCWPGWSGVLAVLFYLLAGGLGLPVFANGASGWDVFQEGSGGYLLGFVAAVWYMRRARRHKRTWLDIGLVMTLASLLILGFGFIRLVQMYGVQAALDYGFYPLWPGALLKIVLATGVAKLYLNWRSQ